jgi:GTPase
MSNLPSVVIVGRPNVGKSTLFNAIHGQRRSIVGDEPGITRDRIRGECEFRGKPFSLTDTGGIIPDDAELIPSEILRQARTALETADQIVFLIDGRTEITSADRDLAKMLFKLGRPVTLAVNKVDSEANFQLTNQFHGLGFKDVYPISAEHKLGIQELLAHLTREFVKPDKMEGGEIEDNSGPKEIRIAIIGRPNVGKSTLLNSLVQQDRSIVSPVAGTTRDAVDESIEIANVRYTFVDTAGIRRKGKTKEMAEKLSVVMAQRHIRMSNVCIVVMDATEGVVGLDATIAGYAHEGGRCVILAVNKWDIATGKKRTEFTQQVRDELKFVEYAPIAHISAKESRGTPALFEMIRKSYESAAKRITTGELNRFVERIGYDKELKIYYISQHGIRPPTFSIFTDKGVDMHFSTQRFVINRLRKEFSFYGTPIVLKPKRR